MVVDEVDAAKKAVSNKQDKLVSGTNIKTINGESILGSGDIDVSQKEVCVIADAAEDGLTNEQMNNNSDAYDEIAKALNSGVRIKVMVKFDNTVTGVPIEIMEYERDSVNGRICLTSSIGPIYVGDELRNFLYFRFYLYSYGRCTITISAISDSELSTSSLLPVQNKVVTTALNNKADKSYVDNAIAENEKVTANALYDLDVRVKDILTRLDNAGL